MAKRHNRQNRRKLVLEPNRRSVIDYLKGLVSCDDERRLREEFGLNISSFPIFFELPLARIVPLLLRTGDYSQPKNPEFRGRALYLIHNTNDTLIFGEDKIPDGYSTGAGVSRMPNIERHSLLQATYYHSVLLLEAYQKTTLPRWPLLKSLASTLIQICGVAMRRNIRFCLPSTQWKGIRNDACDGIVYYPGLIDRLELK
jgi:hypothetical protein